MTAARSVTASFVARTSEDLIASGSVLPADPFQTIDKDGVGQLIRYGIERGRATRANLKVGICGEHGGEAE